MNKDNNQDQGNELADLQSQVSALQKVIKQKDRFMANLSHEIRSPMNGVFGMADALSRTRLDPMQARYLEVLRQSCDKMLEMANQVLDISRFETGNAKLVEVDFDLSEMLNTLVAEFTGRAKARGVGLELDTKFMTSPHIHCDKLRLGQVLSNLISNALRYTDKGRVVVRAIVQEDAQIDRVNLLLSIEDSGIGITPDKQQHVFGAFASADPAETAARGGTGLGLAIVHEIVTLMGGEVRLDSTLGLGSTFTIELQVRHASTIPDPHAPVSRPMPGSLSILLAEDNDSNAFVFTVLLEDTGVEITRARNGEEAVKHALGAPFDLIFMDIQMPLMDGIEAATKIRAEQGTAPRIIALTADIFAQQTEAFISAGFDACLTKPIRQADLLDTLSAPQLPN